MGEQSDMNVMVRQKLVHNSAVLEPSSRDAIRGIRRARWVSSEGNIAMTIDYTLTEKTLTSSDGAAVYAVAAGNPTNQSIVFIHGFALSAAVWEGILKDERLLKEYYLVCFRGFQGSWQQY